MMPPQRLIAMFFLVAATAACLGTTVVFGADPPHQHEDAETVMVRRLSGELEAADPPHQHEGAGTVMVRRLSGELEAALRGKPNAEKRAAQRSAALGTHVAELQPVDALGAGQGNNVVFLFQCGLVWFAIS